jgi:hypothetical protein
VRARAQYEVYLRLDAELGDNTTEFEALHRELERSRGEAQKALAARMHALWEERKPRLHRRLAEYRRLHLELKRLKEAVNAFVGGPT